MEIVAKERIAEIVEGNEKDILKEWMHEQINASTLRLDLMSEKDLQQESQEFLKLFANALRHGDTINFEAPEYIVLFEFLKRISSERAIMGYTPSETATFVLSLKEPLVKLLTNPFGEKGEILGQELWTVTILLDKLGLYTTEEFQKTREKVIKQQQQELLKLSTPVAKLWEGILMLPLIGTLDSARAQMVTENLLQKIVETASTVAIIDIAGIPMVDTLVAQHLIKTMNAARLMGAECIISGIRPQIAQTIIHLGISLTDVVTKATLADAVELAMQKAGFMVTLAQPNSSR